MSTISTRSGVPPPQSTASQATTPPAARAPVAPTVEVARPVQNVSTGNALPQPGTASTADPSAPSRETVQQISEELQRKVSVVTPELQFKVDDSSGRAIITVTDRATNDLIRQIPSEETLEINKGLDRYQQGLLVNRKV